MAGSKLPFMLFLAVLALFCLLFMATPFIAASGDAATANALYAGFAPTCHQLTSRSLCVFKSSATGSFSIGDCFESQELSYSRLNTVTYPDKTGYKIPVCSRDVAIYLAMLAGLLAFPLFRKIESEDWPDKWLLVAAAIPVGLDGVSQLVGLRESSNLLRLITGAIIGFALPFYILPLLNSLYYSIKKGKKKKK